MDLPTFLHTILVFILAAMTKIIRENDQRAAVEREKLLALIRELEVKIDELLTHL